MLKCQENLYERVGFGPPVLVLHIEQDWNVTKAPLFLSSAQANSFPGAWSCSGFPPVASQLFLANVASL